MQRTKRTVIVATHSSGIAHEKNRAISIIFSAALGVVVAVSTDHPQRLKIFAHLAKFVRPTNAAYSQDRHILYICAFC